MINLINKFYLLMLTFKNEICLNFTKTKEITRISFIHFIHFMSHPLAIQRTFIAENIAIINTN